jgi:hypothetical protein
VLSCCRVVHTPGTWTGNAQKLNELCTFQTKKRKSKNKSPGKKKEKKAVSYNRVLPARLTCMKEVERDTCGDILFYARHKAKKCMSCVLRHLHKLEKHLLEGASLCTQAHLVR